MADEAEKDRLISEEDEEEDSQQPDHEEVAVSDSNGFVKIMHRYPKSIFVILLISGLLNIYSALKLGLIRGDSVEACVERSPYVGLARDELVPFHHMSDYNSHDQALADHMWDRVNADTGIVAVTWAEAKILKLPDTQPFPWDENKGIYLMNGMHNLHCLKKIRISVARYRDGLEVGDDIKHAFHCIEALRQDVVCNADDTPRYTGLDQPELSTGLGQVRRCRNWALLEEWAEERHGCWRRNKTGPVVDELERYSHCPKGSPYFEKIHKWFPDAIPAEDMDAM